MLSCGLLSTLYFLAGGRDWLIAFAFEKLAFYQKAVDFADQIAALTEDFPRGYGFLADQ